MKEKNKSKNINNKIKLILLGESDTGKKSLINSYIGMEFKEHNITTISSNYILKELVIDQVKYDIQIWDTAGQERFRSINKIFIKDSQIVIFVYDTTQKKTFNELTFWLKYTRNLLPPSTIFGIAGNKKDLLEEIKDEQKGEIVSEEEGKKYAEDNGALFSQTSAKDDREGFIEFVLELIKKFIEEQKDNEQQRESLLLNNSNKKKNKKFC